MRFYENSRNVFLKNQHPTLRNIPFSRILLYLFHFFRIERDIFIKFLSGYFHLKKKKNTRKMSFIFLEYFGISRWEELFFFLGQIFCHSRNMAVSRRERRATLSSEKNELRRRIIWEF